MNLKTVLLSLALLLSYAFCANSTESGGTYVTITPLHSLVQGVMGETGKADLIVKGYLSPHDFQLKPSQVRNLQNADFIFYIGDGFETFLARYLGTLPAGIRKISMAATAGIDILENRKGGTWEPHTHEHHTHEHHTHEGEAQDNDEEDAHNESAHRALDDHHFWLDPDNAKRMINKIAQEFSRKYPNNSTVYERNASAMIGQIDIADKKIATDLSSVRDIPFIVFHDAFQYFEKHYDLTSVGSILLEPNDSPGIARIREMRAKLITTNAVCIFREPQFSDTLIRTVLEGSKTKIGILDPIGADLVPGAGHYIALLERLALRLKECLAPMG